MMSAGSSGYSASSARTAPRARYGTGAGAWDGTSAVSAAWAQQQAALGLALQGQATVAMLGLQREAQAQQARLLRNATTNASRLQAADRARREGNVRVASMIYGKISLARPVDGSVTAAQERLRELADEARSIQKEIDTNLRVGSPFAELAPSSGQSASSSLPAKTILKGFEDYQNLLFQYGEISAVKRSLATHVARQRAKPQFAAVLNEPEAAEFWDIGEQHEKEGHRCCAYRAYAVAAQLAPAPSAQKAAARLEEMSQDPKIAEEAEVCKNLEWCHGAFARATMLAKARKPSQARNLFAQILEKAPEDSAVFRESSRQYEVLKHLE